MKFGKYLYTILKSSGIVDFVTEIEPCECLPCPNCNDTKKKMVYDQSFALCTVFVMVIIGLLLIGFFKAVGLVIMIILVLLWGIFDVTVRRYRNV